MYSSPDDGNFFSTLTYSLLIDELHQRAERDKISLRQAYEQLSTEWAAADRQQPLPTPSGLWSRLGVAVLQGMHHIVNGYMEEQLERVRRDLGILKVSSRSEEIQEQAPSEVKR